MVGSSKHIRKVFPDWEYQEFTKVGIGMTAALDSLPGGLDNNDIWFVSLGTNDWYTRYTEFVQTVNDVRWIAGDAQIVWGTIHRPLEKGSYTRWNNYMRTRRDPNFSPADWAAYVEEHPTSVSKDGVHPSHYMWLARLYTDQATKFGFRGDE